MIENPTGSQLWDITGAAAAAAAAAIIMHA